MHGLARGARTGRRTRPARAQRTARGLAAALVACVGVLGGSGAHADDEPAPAVDPAAADVERAADEDALGDELAPGEPGEGLEEIKVVARRRTERLEDTPIAVTALGRTVLEDAQIRELNQIQDLVPNLTFNTGYSGVQGSVVIRGVGKSSEDIVFDPGVGMYVDGVLLARDIGQLLPMIDVAQVEVLRGPQGTLFGKNNVGGAINMITVKPQDELQGLVKVGAGNYYSYRTRAMLNVPIVEDTLAARISFASEDNDGYMADVTTGQRASNRGLLAGLVSLRATPGERLTIDVSGSWSRDHTASRGGKCIFVGPSVAAQIVELTGFGGLGPGDIQAACQLSEALPERQFTADNHLLADVESYGVWGTIAYELDDLGPVLHPVLKSITGWREQDPRQRDDTDMTRLAIIQRDSLGGAPTFFGALTRPGWQQQITEELQILNGWWGDRIHSTTGLYLYWDRAFNNQELLSLGGAYVTPGGPFEGLTPTLQQTSIDNSDVAVYHQSTWEIADWLSLTGGVRWTSEDKNTGVVIWRYTNPPPSTVDPTRPSFSPFVQAQSERGANFSKWTPTVSLLYKTPEAWIEDAGFQTLNAYFTYARGFKGGGFSAVQGGTLTSLDEFQPEVLDSFEIGIKGRAWGSKLRFELALFYGLYDDLQVTVTRSGSTPFQVERVVENAAKATTRGFELELQALPLDGLLFTASVGYLDAFYDSYTRSANNEPRPLGPPASLPPTTIDRSGDAFTGVPEWQTTLTGQYQIDYSCRWSWLAGSLIPRIEWLYESGIQYAGDEVPSLYQPSVHRLNARLTWRFNDEQTEVALWGKNLTDAYYFRNSIAGTVSTYGFAIRYYEAPRMYGIEVQHRF
jgi:iron complex outermembrane receptor protein